MNALQPELLAHLAGEFPEAVGWKNVADGSQLRLGEWHARSNRLARGLHHHGLHPGDRVALVLAEDEPLEWLVSYMAVHKAGGVAVPLSARLSGPELDRIFEHAGVAALLAGPGVAERLTSLPALIVITEDPGSRGIAWRDLLDPDPADVPHRIGAGDVADIMYTSGTTGAPKGVVVHHAGLSLSGRVPTEWLGLGFLTSSPFSTTSGSLLICGPMRAGLSGWILPKFDPARWLSVVESQRPVAGFLVPAMVHLILASPLSVATDLSSLASITIGSAPIASEALRRFGALLPSADVTCGYGMTEFGAVTAMPAGDGGRHLGSVGVPLPGVSVRVVGDDGVEVAPGEVGRITIAGDRPPRAYLNDPGGSDRTWKAGWLQSGDLGFLDTDGYLWIVGREKEMIIRGGHNVVPGEVESVLFSHPDVAEAAVAGVSHPVLGEDVAAWVVLRGAGTATVDALRAYLLEQLADYKVPRRITLVDSLPRNEAGKVVKSLLHPDDQPRSTP